MMVSTDPNVHQKCEKAVFDWVQLGVGYEFLLSSFLSPVTNHRNDEYVGNEENIFRVTETLVVIKI